MSYWSDSLHRDPRTDASFGDLRPASYSPHQASPRADFADVAPFPHFYMLRLQNWTVSGVPCGWPEGLSHWRGGGHKPRAGAGAAPVAPTPRAGHAGRLWFGSCRQTVPARRSPGSAPAEVRSRLLGPAQPRPGPGSVCSPASRGGRVLPGPEGSAASSRTGGPRSPPGAGSVERQRRPTLGSPRQTLRAGAGLPQD